MRHRLVVLPDADRDVDVMAEYIARSSVSTAIRFYDAVEKTYERIIEAPASIALYGFPRTTIADLRAWPVRGFPNHLIFYRTLPNLVQVVRLVHAARDLSGISFGSSEAD